MKTAVKVTLAVLGVTVTAVGVFFLREFLKAEQPPEEPEQPEQPGPDIPEGVLGHIDQVKVNGITMSPNIVPGIDIHGLEALPVNILCQNDSAHNVQGIVRYSLSYPPIVPGVNGASGSLRRGNFYYSIPSWGSQWFSGNLPMPPQYSPYTERMGRYTLNFTFQYIIFETDSQGNEIWWRIAQSKSLDYVILDFDGV